MKIVKLEDFHTDGGWENFSFLKITTDEGLAGWAEFNESRGRKGLTGIIHSLGASLVGEDPRNIGRIDASLYAQTRSTTGGLQSHAMAAILNACLDFRVSPKGDQVSSLLGSERTAESRRFLFRTLQHQRQASWGLSFSQVDDWRNRLLAVP